MIFTVQNALPATLISEIKLQTAEWLLLNKETPFRSAYNRVGDTITLAKHAEFAGIDAKLDEFLQTFFADVVSYKYKPEFAVGDSGFEYHRYGVGEECFLHHDGATAFKRGESNSLLRFASIIMHLNTVDVGGETVFPMQNKSFKTIEGQVLVFPPYGTHPHYVTPSGQQREIVMTWMVYSGINIIRC